MADLMTVSYSKIKAWRFCSQSYYYKYVEQIVPRRKPKPLKMGSLVHGVLEVLTKGEDWKPVLETAKKEYSKMFKEEQEFYGNYPDEAERIMQGYLRKYKEEPYKFDYQEVTFGPLPLTDVTAFKFKIDRLAQPTTGGLRNNLFLWETKSGKRIPQDDMRIWDLQTVAYVWGLRKLGMKIKGIIWDYIRTKAPTIPQVLKAGGLSRRADIDTDYFTYLQAIKDNGEDPKDYADFLEGLKNKDTEFYKRILVPVSDAVLESAVQDMRITSLNIFYLAEHPVKNISGWTCPRCDYSSLCYAQLRGLDEKFIRKADFMDRPEEEEINVDESELD